MGYKVKEDEKLAKAIRRVVTEEIDGALETIQSAHDRDEAIHDVRVALKKIRAILRLVRKPIGNRYDKENTFYRVLGRQLASVRDNTAMLESFDKLKQNFHQHLTPRTFSDLRKPFVQSKVAQGTEKRRSLEEVAKGLRAARRRVDKWPLNGNRFADIAKGLKQGYGNGLAAFTTAKADPSVKNLHEWRKCAKELRYQIKLLRPLWPDVLGKVEKEVKNLGDYLSDDHDLALLRQAVGKQPQNGNSNDLEMLIALIDQRRTELQLDADLLGRRIYAEKPARFADRCRTYWRAWRRAVKAKPIEINAALIAHNGRAVQ